MYCLLGNHSGVCLANLHDWDCIVQTWPAIVSSGLSKAMSLEKPSIVRLFDDRSGSKSAPGPNPAAPLTSCVKLVKFFHLYRSQFFYLLNVANDSVCLCIHVHVYIYLCMHTCIRKYYSIAVRINIS